MADDFPPLPQGFTAVADNAATAAPASPAAPASTPPATGDFPKLPQGFTEASPTSSSGSSDTPKPREYVNARGEPLQRFDNPRDFAVELDDRIRGFEINNNDEAQDFANRFGPPGTRVNAENTLKARNSGAKVTNETDMTDLGGWLAHKKQQGIDINPILRLPTEDMRNMAQNEFNQAVLAEMKEHGLSPDDGAVKRFISGGFRSVGQMIEGMEQLGIHAGDALGIIDHAKAQTGFDAIGYDSRVMDAAEIRGKAGSVGNFGGDMLLTSAAPINEVTAYGRAANLAATVGKRVAVGGALGGMQPSDNMSDQNAHIIMGATTMPFVVPIFQKVGEKLGQAGMSTWLKLLGDGQGKKLVDAATNALTPYGKLLKIRLASTGQGVSPEIAEEAIRGLAAHNPAELPDEANMVNEGLSHRENVPLTSGEKIQSPSRIQTYERAKAGSIGGPEIQNEALTAEQNSGNALVRNVTDLGTGADSKEAATHAAEAIHANATSAEDAIDAKYVHLRQSPEPITMTGQAALKASLHDAYDAAGQAGVDTLSPEAKSLAQQLNSLSEAKKPPRFGQIWALSRTINAKARAAVGTSEGVDIAMVKSALDRWMSGAAPDQFASGSDGVIKDLQSANSDYKALNDQFGSRPTATRGGGNLADPTGKAVATIVSAVKQAAPDGPRAGQDISDTVERAIFGSGKGVSTQAANTIKHIAQVAPEAIPHVRDVLVNRLASQITEDVAANGKAAKPLTMQKVINSSLDNLKASGLFTPSEVQSLQNNAYLASLKVLPPDARNVGSGKFTNALVWSLRHSLTRVLGIALGAGEAAHMGASGITPIIAGAVGSEAAQGVGRAIEKGIAKRAISGKIPVQENAVGRGGKAVGRTSGAATSMKLSDLIGGN